MFEELEHSKPECEVSHEDVEDWIHADKGIVVSRIMAYGALIDTVMNPNPESKTRENESSDEGTFTEKISWTKAAEGILHPRSWPKAGHVTRHRK
jgi:hypothetical protein